MPGFAIKSRVRAPTTGAMEPLRVPERPLRALMAYRTDIDRRGGAASVMDDTADALRRLGAEVDVTFEEHPDPSGYDVVHAVNIWSPASALRQLEHLHATGAPVAWQPFYLGWSEYAWAATAMSGIGQRPAHERGPLLEAMASGTLEVNGMTRHTLNEAVPGLHGAIAHMAALVDHVCACSTREMQMLSQLAGLNATPFTLTRHGVDAEIFAGADPEPFRAMAGDEPFVLCVGSVDARKNQAMLAHALHGHDLRLILVGPCYEPSYLELVRSLGDDRLVWYDRLPRELVASAVNAATVHALPSYAEGSALASMEAATAGCPVVVSNRSSEFEYYGDRAVYCDPHDPASIRRAVDLAAERHASEPERLTDLARHIAGYTWDDTAASTLDAWRRAISAGRRRARRTAGIADARSTLVLADGAELCADPSLLVAYAERVTAAHDATLVITVPEDGQAEVLDRLPAAVAAAGLDAADSPDLLALPVAPALEGVVARTAHAVLTAGSPQGAAAHLPSLVAGPALATLAV